MAVPSYFKLEAPSDERITPPELKGEARTKGFDGYSEVISFSFGFENSVSLGSKSGGAGAGKAQFKEFEIEKTIDSLSPALIKALCMGVYFEDAWLSLLKPSTTGTLNTYAQIHMKMVIVKDILFSVASDDKPARENVKLVCGAMEFIYRIPGAKSKLGPEVKAVWSQITNSDSLEIEGRP